jgi:hypothetical protein
VDLRRQRAVAVGCFCLLLLLAGAERRLAEVHLNRLSSSPAFENDDLVDGEEIRIRLALVVDDVREPDLHGVLREAATEPVVPTPSDRIPAAPARWASSRGPPRPRL